MGTNLQDVYDKFFVKVKGEDFTYTQDEVFEYFTTAIGKSYKTICKSLEFTKYTDSKVIYIFSTAKSDGDFELTINTSSYTISVLTSDSMIEISNKIISAISVDWEVTRKKCGTFPYITVKKAGVDPIEITYTDLDETCTDIDIQSAFDGEFNEDLYYDDIELLALNMAYEYSRAQFSELNDLKQHIGTKDFNRLPEKKSALESSIKKMKSQEDEIFAFRQEFYEYKG